MTCTYCGLCTAKQTGRDGNLSFQVWLLKIKNMCDLIFSCLWRGWTRHRALSFLLLIQPASWKTWAVALCDPFPSLLCKRKRGRREEIKKAREIKWSLKWPRHWQKCKTSNSPWSLQVSGFPDPFRESKLHTLLWGTTLSASSPSEKVHVV